MRGRRSDALVVAGLVALILLVPARWQQLVPPACAAESIPQERGSASGLAIPRFVSLKSDRVNLRNGPGTDYPTAWVFRRVGMPVEVLKEYEAWRQVRDSEGATGWVLHSMLSGRRTALVLPWEITPGQPAPRTMLRGDDRETAAAVAIIEAGVIANVRRCDGRWCYVAVEEIHGYIEQSKLWGVYRDEVIR